MSCYTRHLDDLFREAGIEPNKENKKKLDSLLKKKFKSANCPEVWKKVKTHLNNPAKKSKLLTGIKKVL
jgi:hypothetical protein